MLGIIIGVAAVIILVSLVDGLTADIVKRFESMGTNLINVNIRGRGGNRTVTPEGRMEFAEKNSDVIGGVTPMVQLPSAFATVKYGNENITTSSIIGLNEMYPDIRNVEVDQGRFLEFVEIDRRQKSCVVGSYIVKKFFSGGNALGEEIKINGDTYTIIGVCKEKAKSEESSEDDRIYIPYTLATKLMRNGMVGTYSFSGKTKDTVNDALEKIKEYLFSVYNDEDAYTVSNQADALDQINQMTTMMTTILVGIAAISLLVGGIGIMNIMLVSVTERTREIGIRKSLGAKPWDIMSQFVVEAATTSSMGGFIGIALGIGLSYVAQNVLRTLNDAPDFTVSPSINAIIIAFSVSVGIGMIFGFFPAKKAARLNPIDALRYD
jgi:putative ABC transport system permease protein